MATYTVQGHPLNYSDLVNNTADLDVIRGQLQNANVGTTVQMTISAGTIAAADAAEVIQ